MTVRLSRLAERAHDRSDQLGAMYTAGSEREGSSWRRWFGTSGAGLVALVTVTAGGTGVGAWLAQRPGTSVTITHEEPPDLPATNDLPAAPRTPLAEQGDPATIRISQPDGPERLITAQGLLIGPEGGGRPVQLCVMVLTSLPPGCGWGIVVEGIDDVAELEGAETDRGKAWGDFRLEGVYHDGVLTVTEPPVAYVRPDPTRHYPGGMHETDYSEELAQLRRYVAQYPDTYVGWWFDLWERNVLVVAFTEDHEKHKAAIAEFWPYGLKVVDRPHTAAELEAKADEIRELWFGGELTDLLTMTVEEDEGYIDLMIVLADEETVADYQRRFGSELLRITGWLKPVEEARG